ncbi:16S rRNA (guanine(966)-N(2))-methyltransferase RsmD [Dyella sp.]|uniref:16S rRNA (guanine(966)-N(2))-methyltransferase RsmD n=1 Tax=Dyella sp. TaxID=1869338 RepID=UPI0039C8B75C
MSAKPGRIRVIGGQWRNSRLDVPDLPGLRPTPERVRETLFNWLMPRLAGARCLDLCAGTGALGIEALSRGAASAQFVEPNPRAAQALRDNLTRLKLPGGEVAGIEAQAFLRGNPRLFDLVFLDPPFALDLWRSLAERLEQDGWLSPHAWIYVEYPVDRRPELPATWLPHREGRAGEVGYLLLKRET